MSNDLTSIRKSIRDNTKIPIVIKKVLLAETYTDAVSHGSFKLHSMINSVAEEAGKLGVPVKDIQIIVMIEAKIKAGLLPEKYRP